MHQRRTVFVLGAGASQNLGFPLGRDLKNSLARALNIHVDPLNGTRGSGSSGILEALRLLAHEEFAGDVNPLLHACREIAQSMPATDSIDDYIERHHGDYCKTICAKIGIASELLHAEKHSKLYTDAHTGRGLDFEEPGQTWLNQLMSKLTRRLKADQLLGAFDKTYIINFNYDRCVEHYAYLWLERVYGLASKQAAEIASSLKVFHPYGKLGALPYQHNDTVVPFGADRSPDLVLSVAKSLRTYSESSEKQNLSEMWANLSMTKRLVFLGFGFHQQNLDLMQLPDGDERATLHFYASALGIPEPSWEIYCEAVGMMMNVRAAGGTLGAKVNGDCEAFWHEYGETLTR